MGSSGAVAWPEKVVYSRIPSVGPDLLEEASDPCTHDPDLRVWSKAPIQAKPDPLGEVRTPLSGVRSTHNEVPGQGIP
jgi:hypothetical protein